MHIFKIITRFIYYSLTQAFVGNNTHPDRYLHGKAKISVVILPGFGAKQTQYFYGKLADSIADQGYRIYFVPRLGYNLKDIRSCTGIVRDLIKEKGLRNVVLFGHSKGGVTGRYFHQHFNQDGRVMNLIAIGAPFAGLAFANYLVLKRFNEFGNRSKFIRDLNSNTKINDKIYSIIPKNDIVIRNNKDMEIKGGKNIFLKTEGHYRAVNSPENINVVLKILDDISINI